MYKVAGITDEVTTCDCCGKVDLKKTVVLDNGETFVYYGADCAGRTLAQQFKRREAFKASEVLKTARNAQYKNRNNPRYTFRRVYA